MKKIIALKNTQPKAFYSALGLSSLILVSTLAFVFSGFNDDDASSIKNQYEITIERQAPQPETKPWDDYFSVVVRKGHTFGDALAEAGIDKNEASAVKESVKRVMNVNNIRSGQEILVAFNETKKGGGDIRLASLKIPALERDIEVMRDDRGNFITKQTQKKITRKLVKSSAKIRGSLFQSGMNMGVPANIMLEIIKAFSYDVDFQRDIKAGDKFEILYNAYFNPQNKKVKDGEVVYASLFSKGHEIKIYHYTTKGGEADYYTADGQSVRKSLLKTPINGARITSGFGFRIHPLLGYSKMHRGIDFGAATGTPIFAAGNGVVEEVGPKNGYGNYVRIRHSSEYSSAYAHISRFAIGLKPGKKVKQGEVIAYVGSTGMATGPHLHYEILYHGEQMNPLAVKSTPGSKLAGTKLASFRKEVKEITQVLANLPSSNPSKFASK